MINGNASGCGAGDSHKKRGEGIRFKRSRDASPWAKADLLLLNLRQPHLTPLHQPVANLIYAAQSVMCKQ